MVTLLAAGAAIFTSMVGQVPQQVSPPVPSLNVAGSAEVKVNPDIATVSIGVVAQEKTAQSAQNEANKRTNDFIDRAKRLLGNDGTVETGGINLSPVYSQMTPGSPEPYNPQIIGYRADNTLVVRLTNFTKIGPVIDAAVDSGLNNIQGVSFGLKDDSAARQQALEQAVKEARNKAGAMARAAGVELQGIWELNENSARVMPYFEGRMAMASADKAPTTVLPGMVTVSADVTIRYFISRG